MASHETLRQLELHPDWLPPRSDVRVFLGEPGAPEATKVTVEPGNSFSPGMLTFGVTWWLQFPRTGQFFAPELAPLADLHWEYQDGCLPVLHCEVRAGGLTLRHTLFQDGQAAEFHQATAARIALENTSPKDVEVQLFVVVRSLGPAGGPLVNLETAPDHRHILGKQGTREYLVADLPANACGCGVGDPAPLAKLGQVPESTSACDPDGWCFGMLRYDLKLAPNQGWQVALDCPLHTGGEISTALPPCPPAQPEAFDSRLEAHLAHWRGRLGTIELEMPDRDFRNAFFAGLQHMLTAMVGDQVRSAPLVHNLPWLRDGASMIRCLDLAGLHDLARAASGVIERNDFFGGFGAEGDAPGQGIWALIQHYRLTRDLDWLKSIYPSVQRKVDWLIRMRSANRPMQVVVDMPVLPTTQTLPTQGVICLAARDGIIQGVMDQEVHDSLGWINQWAIAGLREAAYAANELGRPREVRACLNEADELQESLLRFARSHPAFFELERTANNLLWPTRAWAIYPEEARRGFDAWYARVREPGGTFQPERYRLSSEAAQAHNALLFGERERAWQVIDYRLRHPDVPGLYGYHAGEAGNAAPGAGLFPLLRGCQQRESITPHGWSQAELWLLQRALLVEEWQDGLLLFAGIPEEWLQPGTRIAFSKFPTWYGTISASLLVNVGGESARLEVCGAAPGTPLQIRLPGEEIQVNMPPEKLVLAVDIQGN